MRKISYGQLCVLLFVSRIFNSLTYVPMVSHDYSMTAAMIGIAITTAIICILVIPVLYLNKKFPDRSVPEVAYDKSKVFGVAVSAIYTIYFLSAASGVLIQFSYFMNNCFPPMAGRIFVIFALAIAALYACVTGIEAIGRAGSIVFVFLILCFGFFSFASINDMELLNFYPILSNTKNQIFNATMSQLSMNTDIVSIALILPFVKSNAVKGTYTFLGLKFLTIELLFFLVTAILGDFSRLVEFPIFTLGSSLKLGILQRLDAIYMVVWSLVSIITTSFYMFATIKAIRATIPKAKYHIVAILTSVFIVSAGLTATYFYKPLKGIINNMTSGIVIAVLLFFIPLIIIFLSAGEKGVKGGKAK